MASTFTTLGIEKMATGENAGTWGDKTNTNLDIVNTAISGYVEQAVTSGGTLALSITDGASTATAQNAVIKLTGTITGNSIVTVPDSVEKVYIVTNGTSGAYTVQFKTASGTGITFGVSEKTTKLLYSDGTNIVDAGFSGGGDLEGTELVLDADGDTTLTADTDDQIDIKIAGADDFQFTANTFTAQSGSTIAAQALTATTIVASSTVQGTTITATTAFVPDASDGAALGTSSLEFSDLFLADGAVVNFGDDQDVSLTHVADTGLLLSSGDQLQFGDAGENISGDGSDLTIAVSNDILVDATRNIILDADNNGQITFQDGGTQYLKTIHASAEVRIQSSISDSDILLQGNDGGATITALKLDMSAAGAATFNSDLTVGGDLTVSGDDITMGTNTAGNLLIADGTNFNSIAAGDLSEISTVANDDVFIAVDTSGGGLKKIARSAIVAGLATSGAISNVVEDTSPQLGGNLDMNGQDIVTTSNANLELAPDGTGTVVIKGNDNQAALVLNCENNSHGQKIQPQPHSVGSSAVHTLPNITGDLIAGKIQGTNFSNSLLVGHATSGTLDASEYNLGVGIGALDALTTADQNVAIGYNAATALDTGTGNTIVGAFAGQAVRNGISNTLIGKLAGGAIASNGHYNICLGEDAGDNITSGDGNVVIGKADVSSGTGDRQLSISGYDGTTTTTWISGDNSGNLTFAGDVTVGDDLNLTTDSAVINFGADSDTTLTHTDGTGLTLNSTNKLCFNDTGTFINSNADGDLDLSSDGTANESIKLTSAGGISLDANSTSGTGQIRLDSAYGETTLMKAGTTFGTFFNDSNNLRIRSSVSDADITFSGNDGGASITALTIDMSAAGQFHFKDGTAALPILSNTGDTDTGLFFSAADTMAFSAGGTSQFTMADGVIAPVTDNDVDLGTSSLEFKDGYFDGTLHCDVLDLAGTEITSISSGISTGTAIAMAIVFG